MNERSPRRSTSGLRVSVWVRGAVGIKDLRSSSEGRTVPLDGGWLRLRVSITRLPANQTRSGRTPLGVRRRVGALDDRGEVATPVQSGDASPHSKASAGIVHACQRHILSPCPLPSSTRHRATCLSALAPTGLRTTPRCPT